MAGSIAVPQMSALLVLVLALLPGDVLTRPDKKCTQKIRLEECQREEVYANRDLVARYTKENVDSLSVEMYRTPIVQPTRYQTKMLMQRYRNMFLYPEEVETVTAILAPNVTERPAVTESPPMFGTTIDTNATCSNTTERSRYQNWIRITETIECNRTNGRGGYWRSNRRHTRYEPIPIPTRVRRGVTRIKLCNTGHVPADKVLYTVSSNKGDPVQLVKVPNAYQDQGDASCTPASGIPRDIACVLELIDTPKVVVKLRGKYLESENVRVPRCTAYREV